MNKDKILAILETAVDKNGNIPMRIVRQAFEKLPESCEDAVSRVDVEIEIANILRGVFVEYQDIAKKTASKLPPVTQRPELCEDAVSRKSILDKIEEVCFSKKQEWVDFRVSQGSNGQRDLIIKFIESLPSIQQKPSISENPNKRKTGKWIHEIVNNYTEKTYCSECGESAPFVLVSDDYYGVHVHGEVRKTDFCPNCGSYNGGIKIDKD